MIQIHYSLIILLLFSINDVKSSSTSSRPQRRLSSTSSLSSSTTSQPQSLVHRSLFKSRSACHFFIWDALSAARYHLCNHLLKDCVYEGLGGKKFVRIKPGSILESLYPPSKHGPDKCLICGMSFQDHLQCWWYPNLYTAYDRHLDDTMKKGLILYDEDVGNIRRKVMSRNNKSSKGISRKIKNHEEYESGLSPLLNTSSSHATVQKGQYTKMGRLSYHRNYVNEISTKHNDYHHRSNSKKLGRSYNHRRRKNNSMRNSSKNEIEVRNVAGIQYSIPKIDIGSKGRLGASVLTTARIYALAKLDQMIWIQRLESQED